VAEHVSGDPHLASRRAWRRVACDGAVASDVTIDPRRPSSRVTRQKLKATVSGASTERLLERGRHSLGNSTVGTMPPTACTQRVDPRQGYVVTVRARASRRRPPCRAQVTIRFGSDDDFLSPSSVDPGAFVSS